jgi:arylsulfatase
LAERECAGGPIAAYDGDLVALRDEDWKVVFEEQRVEGTLRIWAEPSTSLRSPEIFNLRAEPYEHRILRPNLL